jgi:hypothetical protein
MCSDLTKGVVAVCPVIGFESADYANTLKLPSDVLIITASASAVNAGCDFYSNAKISFRFRYF